MYNLEFTFLNVKHNRVDQPFNPDHPALIPNIITNDWGLFPFKCHFCACSYYPLYFMNF